MKPLTSLTHPLRIAELDTPGGGRIGMTFCPGKRDPAARTGPWERDLELDLRSILDWRASVVVTLLETHEFALLGVPDLGERIEAFGMRWLHLPIRDVSIPDAAFEAAWEDAGERLRSRLGSGGRILVHCRGGLGRTGLVAARLLIEQGETPTVALARVRATRPGAVETTVQAMYVPGMGPSR